MNQSARSPRISIRRNGDWILVEIDQGRTGRLPAAGTHFLDVPFKPSYEPRCGTSDSTPFVRLLGSQASHNSCVAFRWSGRAVLHLVTDGTANTEILGLLDEPRAGSVRSVVDCGRLRAAAAISQVELVPSGRLQRPQLAWRPGQGREENDMGTHRLGTSASCSHESGGSNRRLPCRSCVTTSPWSFLFAQTPINKRCAEPLA